MRHNPLLLLVAILFVPMIVGNLHCAEGYEPETVIVPVGEPGDSDPYGNSGMDCGETNDPVTSQIVGEDFDQQTVYLVTFTGNDDKWFCLLNEDEYAALQFELIFWWGQANAQAIDHKDVDGLRQDICAPLDQRTHEGRELYQILSSSLSEQRMQELSLGICE